MFHKFPQKSSTIGIAWKPNSCWSTFSQRTHDIIITSLLGQKWRYAFFQLPVQSMMKIFIKIKTFPFQSWRSWCTTLTQCSDDPVPIDSFTACSHSPDGRQMSHVKLAWGWCKGVVSGLSKRRSLECFATKVSPSVHFTRGWHQPWQPTGGHVSYPTDSSSLRPVISGDTVAAAVDGMSSGGLPVAPPPSQGHRPNVAE